MEPIKTLFLGTDWESVETLKSLHLDPRFEVVGVITQPDKPVGRKREMTASKVKQYAMNNEIPVFHTEGKSEKYKEALEKFNPEINVVKAFGEIIPGFFLEAPKYKSINVHFSLLPKYRGAVPIQAAILNGDKETGLTIMLMEERLDAGDILKQYPMAILSTDTNQSLRERLVTMASEVLADDLIAWIEGTLEPTAQDESKVTFCRQSDIAKEKAEIDWESCEPICIDRMVRAFLPWPVAWTYLDGKRIKIFAGNLIDNKSGELDLEPGAFKADAERLFVGTSKKDWIYQILDLQMEGSNRMAAAEFIRGQAL